MAQRTFKIITLGCKVNQYESAYLEERLKGAGWRRVSRNQKAEVTVVNTCIVTQKASYQSRQALRKIIRENPSGMTVAVGCYAQVFPEELLRIVGINMIAGNKAKGQLPEILINGETGCNSNVLTGSFNYREPFEYLPLKDFSDRTRAFLKIQDGCESFCSYCIVPFARGPLRSLEPAQVIRSLNFFSENGYKEVVLTGIHLGRYGADLEGTVDLKGLLREIGRAGLPLRIRLSSLEPKEIDHDLVEMISSERWICRHLHIPLQSGDEGILKRMNRHYGPRQFEGLINHIYMKIPLAAIGVDVMVGFPGEGDRAYNNSYSLINNLPISYLHVFPFSPREGTPAAKFSGQVDQGVIKDRARAMRDLGHEKRRTFYRSCLGKEFSVLAEGWHSEAEGLIKGLSDNYLSVVFPSPVLIRNRILKIRIEDVEKGVAAGRSL
jgi:threonylcarbamoyladenosine tRNA methylthiotransferase MtaB